MKRKKKVELPVDHNGNHINPGDWLMFDDGPFYASYLTFYGKAGWTAEDENGNFSDNLSNGIIITLPATKKKPNKPESHR